MSSVQVARCIISFTWLYHGIFPKIVHIAPLEALIISSFGFSSDISTFITKAAGIGEIVFGVFFFIFYKTYITNALNIIGLTGLLASVAVLQPQLLIEAFNPVTTNIPLIAFSVILLSHIRKVDFKNR
ncbi:hypothetical protein N480_17230 [Pseudoalteromonas luteoviolacea S2607]|uniref:DoxX-like family protein n=1 Tax=Pseudoalteromonas luteoviolacea TaxID=43657 RepID=UPI0007B05E28|nr:DoxX-like family protein [Pseudoalteromonas luteoviolacea]KZN36441.1 hypothetical protein N480_17230 [Pseudoalteromonas luteoviolacea S2607]